MTILHAGEIGRFNTSLNINDLDDFTILRVGELIRVPATLVASYVIAENTTTKNLVFADSPYTVLITDDYISVDTSAGTVVINLLALATAPRKPLSIKLSTGAPNVVTLTPNGSDTIDNAADLSIASNGNAEKIVPFTSTWESF